jgi:non-lysosomal glucosylceramidase
MKAKRRDFLKMAGLAGLSLPVAHAMYAQSVEDEKDFGDLPKRIEEYQKNHKPIKGARIYATTGEAGTIMCTWPKSDGDKTAVPGMEMRDANSKVWLGPGAYFDEAMNGFEYQVAAHMIWEGMLEKGLATARAVHDRYHPLMRNPYNEIECSDHYSRSMASYGVFLAICGFDYHGPKGIIEFAPKMTRGNFRAPFTVAEGWGSFSQTRSNEKQTNLLKITYGRLKLNQINLEPKAPSVKVEMLVNGNSIKIDSKDQDKKLSVSFNEITFEQDDRIEINIFS